MNKNDFHLNGYREFLEIVISKLHMSKRILSILGATILFPVILFFTGMISQPTRAEMEQSPAMLAATPIFRYPVVPNSVISGYFDHNSQSGQVTFYNGRRNTSPSYGFYFSCSSPSMYDFVGCEDAVGGETACNNNRELWYDGHRGIDYEFSASWHTGATCDPGRFSGITRKISAPAAGRVMFAGYDASRPGNGWHVRIQHDLNGNGNFNDDNFRSNFLHFTANSLEVQTNDLVNEGDDLGLGGSTGYSSSPHLHFEVQKSSDNFQTTVWSVDPYGWAGHGADPWPYLNVRLWRIDMPYQIMLPATIKEVGGACGGCGELLRNNGFESGEIDWIDAGVDIINHRSDPNLPINPYSGDWLAWLGGRNNASDTLYQNFSVPTGLGSARLRFTIRISTEETGGVFDRMYIRLRTGNGNLIQELDYIDNTFSPDNQWVTREVNLAGITSRQGEMLRISFEATTDASLVTNFYLDDVSIIAQAP